ncbi:ribosome maturation factor RimM [Nocardiopsis sp. N85]|uniref:ribosome maturation factor RimM n=1 Tax=Nocardiopsis sp. N85 TaxID=3029400 RepID=UPI00237FD5F4|nr:ribosome maturation factor RimM [Nocardiopsis sp. N85]MDE3721602.1 ribosome maturation factor RimM [Nocardiopsis sp. N85]
MRLVVGRIGRAHGVRGDVAVDVRTDTPEERFVVGSALETDRPGGAPLTIAAVRVHSGRLLVRFKGVGDRDAAEGLRGISLLVDSEHIAPTDDPDEFHDHELIGLTAVTTGGEEIGTVDDVLHHAQDLLVVSGSGGREVLVPFVAELVPEVDVPGGRIVLDPPPGLLDLAD